MKRLKLFTIILPGLLALAFLSGREVHKDVNYAYEGNWAALPWKKDNADLVPESSLKDGQDSAQVDVFYIYPTTYLIGKSWNADIGDSALNRRTDNGALKLQATAFNGSCKVYAPRYRQAVLRTFFKNEPEAKKALETAYYDVRHAFKYYLDHYNNGRPIIIAGHSQGAHHAAALLREFFDGKPLREKLVAAYVIGMPIGCDTFKTIPPCSAPGETGCFLGWNTMRYGVTSYDQRYNRSCINPLTWSTGDSAASFKTHKGSVPVTFDRIDRGSIKTKCSGPILWASRPKGKGYALFAPGDNFHTGDISLFWLDIREHVALQVKNYLGKK
jgi:hypothetical protein